MNITFSQKGLEITTVDRTWRFILHSLPRPDGRPDARVSLVHIVLDESAFHKISAYDFRWRSFCRTLILSRKEARPLVVGVNVPELYAVLQSIAASDWVSVSCVGLDHFLVVLTSALSLSVKWH